MEGFVAHQLHEFETGKLSRRALIETLTLAATTLYATGAKAQADATLKAQLVNHISYTCPEYRPAADWYSKVFNLDEIGASGRARAELTALGVKNIRDGGPRSLHMDDFYGYDVQICGLENNALTDG